MKRKIICLLLGIAMLMSNVTAFAANQKYTPGPQTQQLLIETPISLESGQKSGQTLVLEAGGKAEFEYIQLFDALSVTIKYSASEDTNLTIKTALGDNIQTLFADKTEATINISPELRRNVQNITISADKNITITDITMNKINYYTSSGAAKCIVEYNEYMGVVQDTVAVSLGANAIKVNGAMRFIDYGDKAETALVENGRTYLPVKTLARAFGLYYEDYTDLEYVYLSNDYFELYTSPSQSYVIVNSIKADIERPVIYKNGEAFMPLRLVAEYLGEKVGFRDGIAVVDNKVSVKRILTNDAIFNELKKEFSEFNVSNAVEGKTYHVSKAAYASDTNNGSEHFPFATITKAAEVAKAGDTVIIHEGVYYEELAPKNDGTATSPIIFKAADGEDVQLCAMTEVSDFKHYKDGIYCAVVPKALGKGNDFVTINGVAVNQGRHPNSDTHPEAKFYKTDDPDFDRSLFPTVGDFIVTKDKEDMTPENYNNADNAEVEEIEISSRVDLNQEEKDYWKGAYVIAMHAEGWTLSTGEVISSEKGKITVKDLQYPSYGFIYYNGHYPYQNDYGFLTNHIKTVDAPGEWYVDEKANIIYMIPPEGTKGEDLTIELKQRMRVIDLRGRKGIRIENINTYGGGITMKDSELCVVNGGAHKYVSHFAYSTSPHTGAYDTDNLNPNWAPGRGEMGEYISGENNAFINTEINGSASAGIYMAGLYNYVDNNKVLNTGYGGIYPAGITIEDERWKDHITSPRGGHTVIGNTSKYGGRAVYYNSQNFRSDPVLGNRVVTPTIASEIAFNEFGKGCLASRDGGVTYEHGSTMGNDLMMTQFHHNMIYDNVAQRPMGDHNYTMVVYRDNNNAFQEAYSNIVFNSSDDPEFEGKVEERKMLFKQVGTAADAYTEDYNNKIFMHYPDGIENFKVEHFPNGKPFEVGVEGSRPRLMKNYEQKALKTVIYASDAELDNGAYVDDDGIVRIKESQSSITLKDISFDGGKKKIIMNITGDRFNMDVTNMTAEVIQDGKTVYKGDSIMICGGCDLDDLTEYTVYIPEGISGKADIKLYTNTGTDFGFIKFIVADYDGEIPQSPYPQGSYIRPAGITAEVIAPKGSTVALRYNRNINNVGSLSHYRLGDVWNRTIRYDVTTSTPIDTIQFIIGTGRQWSHGTVTLYLDSLDSKPIGTVDVEDIYNQNYAPEDKTWGRFSKNPEIKFNEPVEPGEHSYYLVFEDNNKGEFCVDFYSIALFDSALVENAE